MSISRYENYKDSGLPWLREIPNHWGITQSRRLFALRKEKATETDRQLTASQKHGVIYQDDYMALEGQRVVQVIIGADILKHVEPNDFVISMRSFQGGIEWCGHRGSISSAYVMLIPSDSIEVKFFSYLFKCKPYIQALQSTSNLVRDGQALRYENFTLIDLPVIPYSEQQTIAAFLDNETAKIDALIAEQNRLIRLLKEKRQAIIAHTVTKGLNPTAPMKDSGIEWLGEVPRQWGVSRLKHVGEAVIGLTFDPTDIVEEDEGMLVLRSSNVKEGRIVFDDNVYVSKSVPDKLIVRCGDILICSRNGSRDLIGKNAMIAADAEGVTFGAFMTVFRSDLNPYLFWVLNSALFEYQSGAFLTSTINQLTIGTLNGCEVPIPPPEERKEIIVFLGRETAKIDALVAEARRAVELLEERRSALISAAVTACNGILVENRQRVAD